MTASPAVSHAAVRPTVASPVPGTGPIAAVLFDLDGTLYRQRPVRMRMARELALATITSPLGALARWRGLQAFRQAQEQMRSGGAGAATMEAQIAAAAAASGIDAVRLRALVDEWMFERPSRFLREYLAEGAVALLDMLSARQIPIGLLSDYPATAKLRGLGLDGRFAPVVCSTDEGVGAFKPDPRGFLHACRVWALEPSQVLYVGDRAEVDGAGAAAAGMPCVIVGASGAPAELPAGTIVLPSLERLCRVLVDGR